jgi:hypothetical protein
VCPCSIYSTNATLSSTPSPESAFFGFHDCHGDILETGLNLTVLVILVWFLNRELEIR